jgi:hypothetical protein
MTELSVYGTATNSAAVVQQQAHMQTQAVQRLADWAASAIAAHEVAESLVQTSFVPEAFRQKAHEATAAILAGAEVGLSPMASLRSFDVIGGTAAPRAITLRAIVQSQGHEVYVKESTKTRAIVCGSRRGSNVTETSTWTLDRAKDLGLTNKANWKSQPQAMLVARATSEVCRLVAADAILGIGYTIEELADEPGTAGTPGTVDPQPATRRMSRRKPPANLDSDAAILIEEAAREAEAEPITDAQVTKLHASFGDLGITDRDQKLAYAAQVLDHPVDSSRDLTKAEAMRIIDALDAEITAAVPALNEPEETP